MLNEDQSLQLPIISDSPAVPGTQDGKVLVGIYEPSSQWLLSFILTVATGLLQRSRVVGIRNTRNARLADKAATC